MANEIDGKVFFETVSKLLNERTKRVVTSAAAVAMGYGGISKASRLSGLSRPTIYSGLKELSSGEGLEISDKGRQRKEGGGRKSIGDSDPEVLKKLESLVKPYEYGNPESPLRWTSKSMRKLSEEMKKMGYNISHVTIGKLLEKLGYTLQSNKKSHEGWNSPDRDAQFEHINGTAKQFIQEEQPVISVDAKKKELIGNYKNNGREYRPSGNPEKVNVYDFIDPILGRAIPYGVYDLNNNEGFVNVGVSHDTAKFAVDSIEKWWLSMGKEIYPDAHSIFITADGGGSNGSRNRLWKKELQKFADKYKLNIYVSHFPPGTSKWNKIEHRMFSFISMNWRAKPLTSLEVVVNLIANTTTKTGLKIKAAINKNEYKTGEKVSDEEMKKINILYHDFHPEWNYAIIYR